MILQIDEKKEQKKLDKDERTDRDQRLQAAGEHMRERGVKRMREHTARKSRSTSGSHSPSPALDSERDEAEYDCIRRELKFKQEAAAESGKVAERRFKIEEHRADRDAQHQRKMEECEMRRLDFEDRRLAIDARRNQIDWERFAVDKKKSEEEENRRLLELEERKAMISVLGDLAKKLG